jgi:hypothetical protein
MRTEQISPRYIELDSWSAAEMIAAMHSSNMDQLSGETGGQGTHIDALGHFG